MQMESVHENDIVQIRSNLNIHPQGSLTTTLRECSFIEEDGIFPFFSDKDIIDIGCGFGGTPWVLKNAKSITLVDPIYRENRRERIRRNIDDLDFSLSLSRKTLVEAVGLKMLKIRQDIEEKSLTIEEASGWQKYGEGLPTNVTIDPSFGEDIDHIGSESVDVVLCNYVLTKATAKAHLILGQAFRIARPGSIIIISDNYGVDERKILSPLFSDMKYAMEIYREDTRFFAVIHINERR